MPGLHQCIRGNTVPACISPSAKSLTRWCSTSSSAGMYIPFLSSVLNIFLMQSRNSSAVFSLL